MPFDFVFARMITGSLKDMPRFFRQSFECVFLAHTFLPVLMRRSNLNPGGFIELQDVIYPALSDDDTLPEDSPLKRWSVLINEAFRGNGRPLDSALHYEKQLADAGFTNIHVIREKWPQNRWPRDKKYKQLGEASLLQKPSSSSPLSFPDPSKLLHAICPKTPFLSSG